MSCKKFEVNISAYFDEELDETTQQNTLNHIEHCESCNSYFKQFKMLQNKMNLQLAAKSAPLFIEDLLMERIIADKRQVSHATFWEKAKGWFDNLIFSATPAVRVAEFAFIFLVAIFAGIQIYNAFGPAEQQVALNETSDIQPIKSEDFVQNDLADYFEKSARVLESIQKSKPSQSVQLTNESRLANELLLKSQIISHKLNRQNRHQTGELLKDLEPLFVDVANYDQQKDRRTVDVWKKTINNNNYISRINLAKTTQASFNY